MYVIANEAQQSRILVKRPLGRYGWITTLALWPPRDDDSKKEFLMIDNIIVFAYLISTLGIGLYYRARSSGFKSFASIKDSAKKDRLLLVATIFASAVGGGTTFGITEKVYSGHISYAYGVVLNILVDIAVAYFIVPRLTKHYGAESIGDIMARYYGDAGRIITGIASLVICLGFIAIQISVSGRIFEYILGIDHFTGIILSYGVVIVYTTVGGLRSVVFSNILQFFAMIITIPLLSLINLYSIDLTDFWQVVSTERVMASPETDLLSETIVVALGFCVMGMYPGFLQRTLINSDHRQTSQAIYIKSAILFFFVGFITLGGLIAYYLFPGEVPGLALACLIDRTMPAGVQGLVVVGLLAAVMSSAEADLNISSISLVKDVLSPIFTFDNQNRLLSIARIMNILIGSTAILMALRFPSIVDLFIFIVGFWVPTVVVPLVFALFDMVIPKKPLILCTICSLVSFILWEIYFAQQVALKGVFVSTLFSIGMFLICYRMFAGRRSS